MEGKVQRKVGDVDRSNAWVDWNLGQTLKESPAAAKKFCLAAGESKAACLTNVIHQGYV